VTMPGEARSWRWFGMLLIAPSVEEDSGEDSAETPEEPEENQ